MSPTAVNASEIGLSVNFTVPSTHWSYTSGPDWRSTRSSTQSVPGQPDAPPDSKPAHQGAAPVFSWIVLVSVSSSSHVFGISTPHSLNFAGEYQT